MDLPLPLLVLLVLVGACVRRAVSEQRAVRFEMREELRPPARVGSLSDATGARTNANAAVSYRLVSASVPFLRVSESDGALTVTERADREALCRRSARCVIALDVALVSGAASEHFELLRVELEVLDVNDHAPVFPSAALALEVSEAAPVGTRLPVDAAHDPDAGTNSVQSYRLSASEHFAVETVTRVDGVRYAELVLVRPLDRETQASHTLQLEAVDGGRPPRSGITNLTVRVLDSNDNSPTFEQPVYTVELPEDAAPGHLLLQLHAVDPDEGPNGQVVFDFGKQASTEVRQLFRLDRRSGRLTLGSAVDYEEQAAYEIDVQASDLGAIPTLSSCKVIVRLRDVNDNRPEVTVAPVTPAPDGMARVSEGAGADALVAVVTAVDRDSGANGRVACSLQGAHGHFRLRRAYEGSYAIVTAGVLDREKIAQYNLSIVAEDFGTPPLRTVVQYFVSVMDVNDNAPVFSAKAYEGFIEENQLPGTYITTVLASDPDSGLNGEVTYELLDGDSNTPSRFAIMNQAGHVYALQSFNHEVTPRLELRVQASDRGWPQLKSSTMLVVNVVDQNDNAPAITQPVLHNGSADVPLPRDAGPGYVVTRIKARDADSGSNAQLTYQLSEGVDTGFSIDQDTGEIYVSRKVSYDVNEELKVTVTVNDNGIPSLTSTATIHFTLTENAPSNDNYYGGGEKDEPEGWPATASLIIILTLTASSIVLIASVSAYFFCSHRKGQKRAAAAQDAADQPYVEKENNVVSLISNQTTNVFDAHTLTSRPNPGSAEIIHNSVEASSDGVEAALLFKSKFRNGAGQMDGYSTLPGYGRDSARPITVWKGNSMVTVAARDPHISGKDSGKGDSDVNDSDSDISGEGAKKEYATYKGLWACTSECRILGHSDRCWSPSAARPNGARHLSTFSRATPSPLNSRQGTVYYESQTSRTAVLQSVAESRQGQCDYIHICTPQPQRRKESEEIKEFGHSTKPIPANSPGRTADA